MSEHEISKDVFEYDGQLLAALGRLHDTISRYAIQNYAACGAVLFFYFTGGNKLPFWLAVGVIVLLCFNFCLAIAVNVATAKKVYVMHRIAIDLWFAKRNRSDLHKALLAAQDASEVLTKRDFFHGLVWRHPAVLANAIPAVGMIVLGVAKLLGFTT